jgi:hypothetical protein
VSPSGCFGQCPVLGRKGLTAESQLLESCASPTSVRHCEGLGGNYKLVDADKRAGYD